MCLAPAFKNDMQELPCSIHSQQTPSNLAQYQSFLMLSRASQVSAVDIAQVIEESNNQAQAPTQRPPQVYLSERQSCLLFVKVLFRYLTQMNHASLQRRAKQVVARCIRQQASQPLAELVQSELRQCIGEIHWARARRFYQVYCRKQGLHLTRATQVQAV